MTGTGHAAGSQTTVASYRHFCTIYQADPHANRLFSTIVSDLSSKNNHFKLDALVNLLILRRHGFEEQEPREDIPEGRPFWRLVPWIAGEKCGEMDWPHNSQTPLWRP